MKVTEIFGCLSAPNLLERRPAFAVLPVGSYEQHGPHLPMETDTLIACSIASKIAERYNCLQLGPMTVSCSQEHSGFYPSIWISPGTLMAIITDVMQALSFHGVDKLCIVNAHGGNHILENIAQEANIKGKRMLVVPRAPILQAAIDRSGLRHSTKEDMHAGELETSILLAEHPELVQMDLAQDQQTSERTLLHLHGLRYYTESGVVGFPKQATPLKGTKVLSELMSALSPLIDEFLRP